MLSCLRFLALVVFGLLTVVFLVMGLISSFMYTRYGSITKKTIRVSGMYLALCAISLTLTLIILDPSKTSAVLIGLAICLLPSVILYVLAGCFNLTLVEKGPRKMLAPVWQFLKRLFAWHDSG